MPAIDGPASRAPLQGTSPQAGQASGQGKVAGPRRGAAPDRRRVWLGQLGRSDASGGPGEGRRFPDAALTARNSRTQRRVETVRRLLDDGRPVEGEADDRGAPLWQACASDAPPEARPGHRRGPVGGGGQSARDGAGETALHAAAARGPLALVELLIRNNARQWQGDRKGRRPLASAKRGSANDKPASSTADRSIIGDPSFKAAVTPSSAATRPSSRDCSRRSDGSCRSASSGRNAIARPPAAVLRRSQAFLFIANFRRLPTHAHNIVEVARLMIAHGVDSADLDYALELVMTSSPVREQADNPAARTSAEGGRNVHRGAIDMALGLASWRRSWRAQGRPADAAPIRRRLANRRARRAASCRLGRGDPDAFGVAAMNQQGGGAAGARRRQRSERVHAVTCIPWRFTRRCSTRTWSYDC